MSEQEQPMVIGHDGLRRPGVEVDTDGCPYTECRIRKMCTRPTGCLRTEALREHEHSSDNRCPTHNTVLVEHPGEPRFCWPCSQASGQIVVPIDGATIADEVDEGTLSAMLGIPVEMLRGEVGPNEQAFLDAAAQIERLAGILQHAWEHQPPGTNYGTVFEHMARAALRQMQTEGDDARAELDRLASQLSTMRENADAIGEEIGRLRTALFIAERQRDAANARATTLESDIATLSVREATAVGIANRLAAKIRAVVAEHVEATGYHPSNADEDAAEDNVLRIDLGLHEVIAQRDRAVRLHKRALAVNRGLRAKTKRKARR